MFGETYFIHSAIKFHAFYFLFSKSIIEITE